MVIPFFRSKDVIGKSFGTFSGYDLFISEARYKEIKETHGFSQERRCFNKLCW